MKDRLEEIEELTGKVVVYRRSDIESEFERRMAKTRGKCVVVRSVSAKNESKNDTSQFGGLYSVTLFTVPLLTRDDAKEADDLIAEIEHKLNGWWPDTIPSNFRMKLKSDGITYIEDPEYDVVQLTLRTPGVPLAAVDAAYDNWENITTIWENL
jgi:hypothetical protein